MYKMSDADLKSLSKVHAVHVFYRCHAPGCGIESSRSYDTGSKFLESYHRSPSALSHDCICGNAMEVFTVDWERAPAAALRPAGGGEPGTERFIPTAGR